MKLIGKVTPIFRIFDEAKAREFYLGFLGFTVVFEHRFGDNFPIYIAIEQDGVSVLLSEHRGDGAPAQASGSRSTTSLRSRANLPPRRIAMRNQARQSKRLGERGS